MRHEEARSSTEAPSPPDRDDQTVTVPTSRLLQNWEAVLDRVERYVSALGIDTTGQSDLGRRALIDAATAPDEAQGPLNPYAAALAQVRRHVEESFPLFRSPDAVGDGFPEWRVNAALTRGSSGGAPPDSVKIEGKLRSMPDIARLSMRPNILRGRTLLRRAAGWDDSPDTAAAKSATGEGPPVRRPWEKVARRRRILLACLVALPTLIAARFMIDVLPHQGGNWLEVTIAVFFGALFGWISIGFWTALTGFVLLLRSGDRFAITQQPAAASSTDEPTPMAARTAIVMPICEEPVERIFAGLKSTHKSLERTGRASNFDFFVLSDSADPDRWVDEELAWFDWCRSVGGFGRIFYRRRRVRIARKSGNVADFCRRWGSQYRYMIVLDADSIMSGEALTRLVEMMEGSPATGLIQTVPSAVGRRTLFGRAQQFAGRVYGPMFAAGLHYWQLGDGQYWGHNAIIRLAPFIEHCALPCLPGKPPLGGEILSHDFVEAALLGKAGWDLWLAYDLPGSYEESPASLLEEMKRDRRWCQGNLQHLRLVLTRGLEGPHRALFINGVMSYVSALLWFTFLALSTADGIWEALRPPDYFPVAHSLFPDWPIWRPGWAIALAIVTAAFLFLPKILSLLLIAIRGQRKLYGGFFRLAVSALLETILSSLLAPIRMVFHTRFVLTNLFGHTVTWRSSSREESETPWGEALRHHGFDTVFASAWGLAVFWLNPSFFWWLTPIVAGLVLAVPVSVLASRATLGEKARRNRLFLTPEETTPPAELEDLQRELATATAPHRLSGFVRAVVDPMANAIHQVLLGPRRSMTPALREERRLLAERAVNEGAATLTPAERRILLYDPQSVTELHRAVWAIAEPDKAERWKL